MQTVAPMAPPKTTSPTQSEGALFDFDDLQALRDEYEERIARLEREKAAAVDVLKKDADNRHAAMQRDYEARLQNEASSRQELIHELTFELAAAREDGERRAQEADKRRLVVEGQLQSALSEIGRIEHDLARLKDVLVRALEVRSTQAAPVAPPAPQAHAASAARPTPPPVPAEDGLSPALSAFAPVKKKKIRLR